MNNTNSENKNPADVRIREIFRAQAHIEDLLTKCRTLSPPSAATQLLAAADKFIDVGWDLNSIASCMVDAAGEVGADGSGLDRARLLAWADWISDAASDIIDGIDLLIGATDHLICPSLEKMRSASAIRRSLKKGAS